LSEEDYIYIVPPEFDPDHCVTIDREEIENSQFDLLSAGSVMTKPRWSTRLGYRVLMWLYLHTGLYYWWSRWYQRCDLAQRKYRSFTVPKRETLDQALDFAGEQQWRKDSVWEFGDAIGSAAYFEYASEHRHAAPLLGGLNVGFAIWFMCLAVVGAAFLSPWTLLLFIPALVALWVGVRGLSREVSGRDCDEFGMWYLAVGREGLKVVTAREIVDGHERLTEFRVIDPVGLAQVLMVEVHEDGSEEWGGHNVAVFRLPGEGRLVHLSNWGYYAGRDGNGYESMYDLSLSVAKSYRWLMGWSIVGPDLKTRPKHIPKRDWYRYTGPVKYVT
jgi:hypothetical protein